MYTYNIVYEPVIIESVEHPKYNIYYYENGIEILKEFHSTDGVNGTIRGFANIIQSRQYATDHSVDSSDSNCLVEMNAVADNVLEVSANTNAVVSIGTRITVVQLGIGETRIEPAPGVTIYSAGGKNVLNQRYSVAHLIKKATNEWYLYGDLREAIPYLKLVWDDISNVTGQTGISDVNDVAQWNSFFNTSGYATNPFTSVVIDGNIIRLYGATNLEVDNLAGKSIVSAEGTCVYKLKLGSFTGCALLNFVNFPNCIEAGPGSLSSCAVLETVKLKACVLVKETALSGNPALVNLDLSSCETLEQSALFQCTALPSISLPACLSMGNSALQECTSLVSVDAPLCTSIGDVAMSGCPALKTVFTPAAASLGSSTANNDVFAGCTTIENITVPVVLETIDGGNPDGDLVNALANNAVLATNGITYV